MATNSLEAFEEFWSQNSTALPHDSRVPLIFAVEIPVIVLTVLVVALRFYARTCVKKALGWDDWVMGLATIFAVTETTINCVATKYGTGRHAWDIERSKAVPGGRLAYTYAVLFTPAVVLAKLSICMTYLRIFPKPSDRLFCKATILWLVLTGIGCTIAIILPCIPIEAYWDYSIRERKCYNPKLGLGITSVLNTTTDLAVFLWPAPRLFSLRLPLQQRLGLIFVFSVGCLTCAAGIARIWYIFVPYFESQDIFYNLAILYVLSSLDCNLGILCGSLPEIRVLFSSFSSKTATVFNESVRRKPLAHPSNQPKRKLRARGEMGPKAYDLEKSIRPRPDADELQGNLDSNSRQISIQVMLDEEMGHHDFASAEPLSSNISSSGKRTVLESKFEP